MKHAKRAQRGPVARRALCGGAALAALGVVAAAPEAAQAHHFYDVWLETEGHPLHTLRLVLSEPMHFTWMVATLAFFTICAQVFAKRGRAGRASRIAARGVLAAAVLAVLLSAAIVLAP